MEDTERKVQAKCEKVNSLCYCSKHYASIKYRYTVMVLLREMDPESVRRRGARQMKRRVYISMVK